MGAYSRGAYSRGLEIFSAVGYTVNSRLSEHLSLNRFEKRSDKRKFWIREWVKRIRNPGL